MCTLTLGPTRDGAARILCFIAFVSLRHRPALNGSPGAMRAPLGLIWITCGSQLVTLDETSCYGCGYNMALEPCHRRRPWSSPYAWSSTGAACAALHHGGQRLRRPCRSPTTSQQIFCFRAGCRWYSIGDQHPLICFEQHGSGCPGSMRARDGAGTGRDMVGGSGCGGMPDGVQAGASSTRPAVYSQQNDSHMRGPFAVALRTACTQWTAVLASIMRSEVCVSVSWSHTSHTCVRHSAFAIPTVSRAKLDF